MPDAGFAATAAAGSTLPCDKLGRDRCRIEIILDAVYDSR
jgi:hypothetical protein